MDEEYILDLDRPRKLRYGFKATRLIRKQFGGKKDLTDVLDINVDEIPFFIWAGLVWEDESLTVEKVEELVDEKIPGKYRVIDVINIVVKAIADQIGVPEKKVTEGEISSGNTEKQPSESESSTKNLSSK
jgi:hypothetical protein